MPRMLGAWEVLERAGVPFGRSDARPDLADLDGVARATRAVLSHPEPLAERKRIALLAWLRAWHSDWPTAFQTAFGADGDRILERTAEGEGDLGRYLKLRRIARERLAAVL